MQDTVIAAYFDYLQAGDVVPGWALIHPDDNSVYAVNFQEETAEKLTTDDLIGHLIRVKIGNIRNNYITFIADTGSPTSFVNNKTAVTLQNTVSRARHIQINKTTRLIECSATMVTKFRRSAG